MKYLKYNLSIYVGLCLLLLCLCFPISSSAEISYTHIFDENEISTQLIAAPNGQVFTSFCGRDLFGSGDPGQPEMPYKVIRFLVPDEATGFTVKVDEVDGVSTYPLEYPLYPVQNSIAINDYSEDLFTYSNSTAYRTLSTKFKASVLEDARIEGKYHVVSVGLWPWAWTGSKNRLEVCNTMQITLSYTEPTGHSAKKKSSSISASNSFVNIADIVVNSESHLQQAIEYDDEPELNGLDSTLPRYYIITEKKLLQACEDLATWKTQKGYSVIRKAIEDIYGDSRYKVGSNGIVDEAASLRKYLQDEFTEHGTFFCLLVGDHRTRMPIRKAYARSTFSSTDAYNGDKYIPTDSYFSNLADDKWIVYSDSVGHHVALLYDKYFDSKVSFDPYIYIGRLLCHSAEEINNYTSKLILYESNPGRGDSQYLNNTLVSIQSIGMTYSINKHISPVVSTMESIFNSVECIKDTTYINPSLTHFYPTGKMMLDKINQSGYCSLMGHGEPTTIACSGLEGESSTWEYIKALESYRGKGNNTGTLSESNISYQCDKSGLDLMDNYNRPSVIYTFACSTEPFDIYKSFDVPHTMASSYTCGGRYGGVAYLGNTRDGYWISSPDLEQQFLTLINSNPVVGIAEAISKVNLDNHSNIKAAHNLIGDPEFSMWLKSPDELSVSVRWEDDFRISGFDANGCTVVQNDGEGNIRRKTTSLLRPSSPVGYPSSGKMKVLGVFKDGYLPQIRMECSKDNLTNCDKKFIVRTADIGLTDEKSVFIGTNATVNIKAIEEISTGEGLSIEEGGDMTLRCDKTIDLAGSEVNSGGALHLNGEKVILSAGFTVKAGGYLSIRAN